MGFGQIIHPGRMTLLESLQRFLAPIHHPRSETAPQLNANKDVQLTPRNIYPVVRMSP